MHEDTPYASARSARRIFGWLAAFGFVVRFLYFAEHARSAFFNVAILDERYYVAVARALLGHGDLAVLDPGFRPLLYPAFLALTDLAAGLVDGAGGGGTGTILAVILQHLVGLATGLLAADLAARLFRRAGAAVVTGGLYFLAGPPLYFEGELLITGLFTFLVVVLLRLLRRARLRDAGRDAAVAWLVAGGWTALAAQARPNLLILAAAFPAVALVGATPSFRRRAVLAGAALGGLAAGLVLIAAVQRPLFGRFLVLTSSGGVNFYLGNKAGADGMIPRQDRAVTYGEGYRDSVQIFAAEVYREETGATEAVSPSTVSRYWWRRAADEILADPGRWLALLGRKVVYLTWDREIPNNKSYEFVRRHESRVLRRLPVRWWLLFALAPLGVVLALRQDDPAPDRTLLLWILSFLLLYAAGIALFFVNSRYRIPLWPAMAILAGGGALRLLDGLRRRRPGELGIALLVAAALAAVSLTNWFDLPEPSFARDHFFRSLAWLEKENLDAALEDARRSVELDPFDGAAQFQLATVALEKGHLPLAWNGFLKAAELAPQEPRVYNNLGVTLERLGRLREAHLAYLQALERRDDYAPALVNAALIELRAGWVRNAEWRIRRAAALGHESVGLYCAEGFLHAARGETEDARLALERARALDPETAQRLIDEHRRRLRPSVIGREPEPSP